MATLKDIAAHLGLSPATVSRALNDFPEVNAKTKTRVREAARRMNYRPNKAAQRLVSGRSGMIGVILMNAERQTGDPTFFEVTGGLSQHLAKQDLDLIFQVDMSSDPTAPYRRLIEKSAVDGFLIQGPMRDDPRIAYLQRAGVPFAVHGRADPGPADYAFYDIDNYAAGADAARLLAQLGHRRIGFVNGPEDLAFAQDRGRGVLETLRQFDGAEAEIHHGPPTQRHGYDSALALLEGAQAPTAILCASTLTASGVCRALRQRGLRCPQDVSVLAHDDGIAAQRAVEFDPPLTVTRAPLREACQPLAEMIGQLVNGAPPEQFQTTARAELIVRGSTGPAPRPAQQGGTP